MSTDTFENLQRVMQKMKTAAENRDWETLQKLDCKRMTILQSQPLKRLTLFDQEQQGSLVALDREILATVSQYKERQVRELKAIQSANHAVVNYRSAVSGK